MEKTKEIERFHCINVVTRSDVVGCSPIFCCSIISSTKNVSVLRRNMKVNAHRFAQQIDTMNINFIINCNRILFTSAIGASKIKRHGENFGWKLCLGIRLSLEFHNEHKSLSYGNWTIFTVNVTEIFVCQL